MKYLLNWFHNLLLYKKIIYIVIIAGIIPISIMSLVSAIQLNKSGIDLQRVILDKGYEQTYQSVDSFLQRMYNTATLAAVNDSLIKATNSKKDHVSEAEELMRFESVSSFAFSLELNSSELNVVYFIDDAFLVANTHNARFHTRSSMENEPWYDALTDRKGIPTWVTMQEKDKYGQERSYFATVRSIWDDEDYTQAIGVVGVLTELQTIESMLMSSIDQQLWFIESDDGIALASNHIEGDIHQRLAAHVTNETAGYEVVQLDGVEYYVQKTFLNDRNLYLTSLVPKTSMNTGTSAVFGEMFWLYFFVVGLLILLSVLISKPMTSRIRLLDKRMTEGGKLIKIESEPHQDEIGRLISRYNIMVEEIEELMERQFLMGQEKIGAELKALQSQINPHFLYNTLDMLSWMARKDETDNIQETLQAMSTFYRKTLSKGSDVIRIDEEIKMCEAYIQIQMMRYKGKINFDVAIDEDLYDCLIPKITLQPIIENSIVHGINEKSDSRGKITVQGFLDEGRILLSVTDDGAGMNVQESSYKSKGSHYGMMNIEKRLSLFYGEEIFLQIDSSMGIGTCVSLNIPIRK